MHAVKPPEQRNFVRQDVREPNGKVEYYDAYGDRYPNWHFDQIKQTDLLTLRPKANPTAAAGKSSLTSRESSTTIARLVNQRLALETVNLRRGRSISLKANSAKRPAKAASLLHISIETDRPAP